MGDSYIYLVIQILLIIGLFIVVVYLLKIKNSLALEKRITRFSTESLTDRPLSFFDKLNEKYNNLISKITKNLSKSKMLIKYSLRYDKYLDKTKIIKDKAMNQAIIASVPMAPMQMPVVRRRRVTVTEPEIKLPPRGSRGPVHISELLNPILEISKHPDRNRLLAEFFNQ